MILFPFRKFLILSFEFESISISKTIVDTVQATSPEMFVTDSVLDLFAKKVLFSL